MAALPPFAQVLADMERTALAVSRGRDMKIHHDRDPSSPELGTSITSKVMGARLKKNEPGEAVAAAATGAAVYEVKFFAKSPQNS